MKKLMMFAALICMVGAPESGWSASEAFKGKLRAKIAELKGNGSAPSEMIKFGPDMTERARPQKGDLCRYQSREGLQITQFISSGSGFAEDTLVIVRRDDWNSKSICVKIIDDAHEYVDGDKLASGVYRYLGVKSFVGSRIPFYEEISSSEISRIKEINERKIQNALPSILEGMVEIPGRNWMMGKTEVTQAQWMSVMGENPSRFDGRMDNPVEQVSWDDCQVFIKRLNAKMGMKFRLPTEEEWEYCCRAGSTGDWGRRKNGQEGPLDAMGWFGENSGDTTHPVAQKEPNAWGLYDMHGNVWEWTSTADGDLRVNRGGGWDGYSGGCPTGRRSWYSPGSRDNSLGFRLVSEDL